MVKRKKKSTRKIKETMLFVGEGKAEKAFLLHLKSLYSDSSLKVSTKDAGGKGPSNVIGDAISSYRHSGFDRVSVLLDTDIKWPVGKTKEASQLSIKLIGSNPCLEGFLLEILDQRKPNPCTNKACKNLIHPQLSGKETDKESYKNLFTKVILDDARNRVDNLDLIIKLLCNIKTV